MRGELTRDCLPDVLRQIYTERRSGSLRLTQDHTRKEIFFELGAMIFASSNRREDRIGETMLRHGTLSQSDFELVQSHMGRGKRFGKVLIDMRLINERELTMNVTFQVLDIIYSLFNWTVGSYEFIEIEKSIAEDLKLELSTASIILEGVRRIDDVGVIERGLGDLNRLLGPSTNPLLRLQTLSLKPLERQIIELAREPISVFHLLISAKASAEAVLRSLYGLLSAGVLERFSQLEVSDLSGKLIVPEMVRQTLAQEEPIAIVTKRATGTHKVDEIALRRRIDLLKTRIAHGDHYEILGVNPEMSREEIHNIYYKLAREFHPDRYQNAGKETRAEVDEIFARITNSYETLRSLPAIFDQQPLQSSQPFITGTWTSSVTGAHPSTTSHLIPDEAAREMVAQSIETPRSSRQPEIAMPEIIPAIESSIDMAIEQPLEQFEQLMEQPIDLADELAIDSAPEQILELEPDLTNPMPEQILELGLSIPEIPKSVAVNQKADERPDTLSDTPLDEFYQETEMRAIKEKEDEDESEPTEEIAQDSSLLAIVAEAAETAAAQAAAVETADPLGRYVAETSHSIPESISTSIPVALSIDSEAVATSDIVIEHASEPAEMTTEDKSWLENLESLPEMPALSDDLDDPLKTFMSIASAPAASKPAATPPASPPLEIATDQPAVGQLFSDHIDEQFVDPQLIAESGAIIPAQESSTVEDNVPVQMQYSETYPVNATVSTTNPAANQLAPQVLTDDQASIAEETGAQTSVSIANQERAEKQFIEGRDRFHSKDFAASARRLREAVKLNPYEIRYRLLLGHVLCNNPRWHKEAEEQFREILKLDPTNAMAHVGLAQLYTKVGLHRRAESEFREALKIEPNNTVARKGLRALQDEDPTPSSSTGFLSKLFTKK